MKTKLGISLGFAVLLLCGAGAYATPFVEEFDETLAGWTAFDGTEIIVGDPGDNVVQIGTKASGYLFQPVALDGPGNLYRFQFDYKNALSSELFGGFYDQFVASLWFATAEDYANRASWLDSSILPNPEDSITVLEQTYEQANGWQTFTYDFESAYDYAILTFDFVEWNNISGDGTLQLDSIKLNAVPEPVSLVLLGCLGAGMAAARKIRRRAARV